MGMRDEGLSIVVGRVVVIQEGEPIGAGHRRRVSGKSTGLRPSNHAGVRGGRRGAWWGGISRRSVAEIASLA